MDESIKASRVVFLLGAGASKEAGVPLTKGFVDEFLKDLKGNALEGTAKKVVEKLNEHKPNEVDVELLLDALSRLQLKEEDPLLWYYEGGKFLLAGEAEKGELVQELKNFIKSKAVIKDLTKIQYLEPFLGFLEEAVPVDVVSLNYDTAIEQFCNFYKRTYQDGFAVYWNPKTFSEEATDIRLYKVHGSVMWYETDRGDYMKVPVMAVEGQLRLISGEKAENLMLYPIQKLAYVEPLLELLVMIKRILESPTCEFVIAVGYSFRDDHVRQIMWDAARKNRKLTMLIIDPAAYEIYTKRLEFHKDSLTPSPLQGRVICLPYLFERYFPALRRGTLDNLSAGINNAREANHKKALGQPTDFSQACFQLAEGEHVDSVLKILDEEGDRVFLAFMDFAIGIPSRAVFSLFANGRNTDAIKMLDILQGKIKTLLGESIDVQLVNISGWKIQVSIIDFNNPSQRQAIVNIINTVARLGGFVNSRISFLYDISEKVRRFQTFVAALHEHLNGLVGDIPLNRFIEERKEFISSVEVSFRKELEDQLAGKVMPDMGRIASACLELERHRLAKLLQNTLVKLISETRGV